MGCGTATSARSRPRWKYLLLGLQEIDFLYLCLSYHTNGIILYLTRLLYSA